MSFENKNVFYLLIYFQIYINCAVMKILLLKQKGSVCASQTRSACTHSKKEMETSNNGADWSAQSNKGMDPSAHLHSLSRKNHPAQSIVEKDNLRIH